WSQMLYMTYGPDGQVWVIDWYDMQQCHLREPDKHDRSNGRIYRISYNDALPVKVDLQKLRDDELIKLLTHDNEWYRRHAMRLLRERMSTPQIARTFDTGATRQIVTRSSVRDRFRAMWLERLANDVITPTVKPEIDWPNERDVRRFPEVFKETSVL